MSVQDIVTSIGNSLIQHGPYNDRIYLMKYSPGDDDLISHLNRIADLYGYSKIFAKVPERNKGDFITDGYVEEARVPAYYSGTEDAVFLSKYLSPGRMNDPLSKQYEQIINTALSRRGQLTSSFKGDLKYSVCDHSDAEEIAGLYSSIFESYPFPVFDPEYILDTMNEGSVYFSIMDGDRIVSLSSAEIDKSNKNVEMTDFATLPEYRGMGHASFLLSKMDHEMQKRGIKTAYTIARARSYGMNITFAKNGYDFQGTIINNTNIAGSIESMNIWSRSLDSEN